MTWKLRPEILLCPNIPQPLHGLAPRVVLGKKWWDQTRYAAFNLTRFRCHACGVSQYRAKRHQWLEGHEIYYVDYRAGRSTYLETVGLCHYCHSYIHDGRLIALVGKREIAHGTVMAIINHGNKVLREAGLERPSFHEREETMRERIARGLVAPWSEWRLVLFGKEYRGFYPTLEDWERAHERHYRSGYRNHWA